MEHIEMVDKRVTVNKIDEDGNSLSGAEFAVFDEDGNLVDTWVSDSTLHYVSGLLEGKTYRLVELTTPSGYYPSDTIEFTVTYDKETQNIEVVNYRTEVASQALSKLPQTGF